MEAVVARTETRMRIVEVAARLLREQGPAAVTTRAVAEAAGVQAPTLYRQFGDKDGLLEAVAEHVMAQFVAAKAAVADAEAALGLDPVEDLRAAWQAQIDFALANPALVKLLSDPNRVQRSPAAASGRAVLAARVHRVAVAGRLRVGEARAVELILAAGAGAIATLLAEPDGSDRSGRRVADDLLDAVLDRIVVGAAAAGPDGPDDAGPAAVIAVRALAPDLDALTPAERQLLVEWLDRVAADG